MAKTESKMVELGSPASNFSLPAPITGQLVELESLSRDKAATLVMFICNHCPYVKHVALELTKISIDYSKKGLAIVAVNSNDVVNYPEDSPEKMIDFQNEYDFDFPYLFDDSQEVARAYQATCTPDFFLYDRNLRLVYRGQLDDSRPENGIEVSGSDLRGAIDAVLTGAEIPVQQRASMGCNIKWK